MSEKINLSLRTGMMRARTHRRKTRHMNKKLYPRFINENLPLLVLSPTASEISTGLFQ
jgi:hypothetical protein